MDNEHKEKGSCNTSSGKNPEQQVVLFLGGPLRWSLTMRVDWNSMVVVAPSCCIPDTNPPIGQGNLGKQTSGLSGPSLTKNRPQNKERAGMECSSLQWSALRRPSALPRADFRMQHSCTAVILGNENDGTFKASRGGSSKGSSLDGIGISFVRDAG
jgi:hypothetical protein